MHIQEIFISFFPGYVSHISTILDNDKTFISCKERKQNVSSADAVRPPVPKTRYVQTAEARQRQKNIASLSLLRSRYLGGHAIVKSVA